MADTRLALALLAAAPIAAQLRLPDFKPFEVKPFDSPLSPEKSCYEAPNSSFCICGKYPDSSACRDARKREFEPLTAPHPAATPRSAQPHAAHRTLQFSHPDATLLAGMHVPGVLASPLASKVVQELVALGVPAAQMQEFWPLMSSIDQLTLSQKGSGQPLTLLSGELKVKGMDRPTPTLLMGDIDGAGAERLRAAQFTASPLAREARRLAARADAWVARDARTLPAAAEWPGLRTVVVAYLLAGGLAAEVQTTHETAAQAAQFASGWMQQEAHGWTITRNSTMVRIRAAVANEDAPALLAALPFHPRPAQPAPEPEAPRRAVIHGAVK